MTEKSGDRFRKASLKEIIEQLESCSYECEAGTLKTNVAFIELKRRSEKEEYDDEYVNGLYNKYEVRKAATGEYVLQNCFVLIPNDDPAARAALIAYAGATKDVLLAVHIEEWIEAFDTHAKALQKFRSKVEGKE